jgi:hypothetical protein
MLPADGKFFTQRVSGVECEEKGGGERVRESCCAFN